MSGAKIDAKIVFSTLYIMLIATLPLFSVRLNMLYHQSITLVLLVAIFFTMGMYYAVKPSTKIRVDKFDFLILSYLFLICLSVIFINQGENPGATVKSVSYFLLYFFLKQMLYRYDYADIAKMTLKGVFIGMATFFLIAGYAAYKYGNLSIYSANYYNFTLKIFRSLNTLIDQERDFESRFVMRNALGEIFAFYFISLMVFSEKISYKIVRFFSLAGSLFLVIFSFSRRALVSVLIVIFLYLVRTKENILYAILVTLFILFSIYYLVFVVQSESRLTSLHDTQRIEQFSIAMDTIENKLLFGYGYGAKIMTNGIEQHVHNFIIAHFYMMGLVGLSIATVIFIYLTNLYLRNIIGLRNPIAVFLIIPILGSLLVGSSIEGIFTPVSWIILALYFFASRTGLQYETKNLLV